ncbi:MAG TPA: type II secretion system F family protein [Geminicoccaceae bacterium]|nr:type II secretion system F family protein [Geminicoccaceae bacterium]
MSIPFSVVLVLAFIAGVLALEGVYLLWNEYKGPDARRLERRLRNLSAGAHGEEALKLLKRDTSRESPWLGRIMLAVPRLARLDRLLEQAGLMIPVSQFLLISAASAVGAFLLARLLPAAPFWFELAIGALGAIAPYLVVAGLRRRRLGRIEEMLPEAVDLIARALRAGHAFPAALEMVGNEMVGPIATEFRITSEEVNFGVPMDDAFQNLAVRVPSDDLRFFVIAVLLQRETGGNLAEVLGNISNLIRSRFQLMGKVRVLATEGKLSAWVLTALPLGAALMMNLIAPDFMSTLWTDPVGLAMIYACMLSAGVAIFWMWRIVKIRV